MHKSFKREFLLLQIGTIGVFLGRAWQHLYWDAPYRAFLWDESLMKTAVENIFGISWQAYITSYQIDHNIQLFIKGIGGGYLIAALAVLLIHRFPLICRWVIGAGGVGLIILAILYCKERFFAVGQFFEYTLQWSVPFFLIVAWQKKEISRKAILFMKIAIALTFSCHGLYAIGYYPRPGGFAEMVMNILGVGEAAAVDFLIVAAILDFIISGLIFLPGRYSLPFLGYAVVWGFLTSIARVWAYFHIEFWQNSLSLWLHESLYRFPHFLVPLVVFLWIQRWKRTK